MFKRTWWVPALAITAMVFNAVPSHPAMADVGAPSAGKTHTVTLLTGDVVTVRDTGSGCPQATVRPADENAVIRQSCGPDGHLHVIPARVASQIGSVLDPDLFDVTTLIADGYDDDNSPELPLIVQPATASARVAALGDVLALPSIGCGGRPRTQEEPGHREAGHELAARRREEGLARPQGPGHRADRRWTPPAWTATWVRSPRRRPGRPATPARASGSRCSTPAPTSPTRTWSAGSPSGPTSPSRAATPSTTTATVRTSPRPSPAPARPRTVSVAAWRRTPSLVIGKVLDDHGYGDGLRIIAAMEWAADPGRRRQHEPRRQRPETTAPTRCRSPSTG